MSEPNSPKSPKPLKSPKAQLETSIDTSLESWIYNIRTVLHFPGNIFLIIGLLVFGTFIENIPREVINLLDNPISQAVLFILPLTVSLFISWSTGLLTACICLIIFTRIQKLKTLEIDEHEGFLNGSNDSIQSTKLISNPHRWFIEKVLGETPLAISSDRIQTTRTEDSDNRTSSSSSMSNSHTSDSAR